MAAVIARCERLASMTSSVSLKEAIVSSEIASIGNALGERAAVNDVDLRLQPAIGILTVRPRHPSVPTSTCTAWSSIQLNVAR